MQVIDLLILNSSALCIFREGITIMKNLMYNNCDKYSPNSKNQDFASGVWMVKILEEK